MTEKNAPCRDWKNEYYAVLKQLGLQTETLGANRGNPRFRFTPPEKTMLLHMGGLTGVLNDISVGGISFHSGVPLTVDRDINLSFDHQFSGKVKIINTFLDDSDSSKMQFRYRHGTRFLSDDDGYRCIVQSLRFFSRVPQI